MRHLRPDGKLANAQVIIGNVTVMLSEASESYPPMPGSFYLYVGDADTGRTVSMVEGGLQPTISYRSEGKVG